VAERPLTDQMREYLAALYWCGSVQGFAFGPGYDSTRKALVKRGLLHRTRVVKGGRLIRHLHTLTEAGLAAAAELPDPRKTSRSEPLSRRLQEVREGRW